MDALTFYNALDDVDVARCLKKAPFEVALMEDVSRIDSDGIKHDVIAPMMILKTKDIHTSRRLLQLVARHAELQDTGSGYESAGVMYKSYVIKFTRSGMHSGWYKSEVFGFLRDFFPGMRDVTRRMEREAVEVVVSHF